MKELKFKPKDLNKSLVKQQKVSLENQLELCKCYDLLDKTIQEANESTNMVFIKNQASKVEVLEFELQRLWNFDIDKEYHRYWLDFNACRCPRMDNLERLGYGRIVNLNCSLHGDDK